jgi:uncharacterized protein YjiS (DUF1127 family)
MSLNGGSRLISEEHQNITRDISAWLSRLYSQLSYVVAYLAAKRRRIRELDELRGFNDRELWDVGLSRSDIFAIEKDLYRRD